MNKVKITVEQEKALERYKDRVDEKNFLSGYVKHRHSWLSTQYSCLGELSFNDFSLLLHGWYEVEQPFKVGDWFCQIDNSSHYVRIVSVSPFEVLYKPSDDKKFTLSASKVEFLNFYSKLEESYKIMLLNLGREKPEFKAGDILILEDGVGVVDWYTEKEIINLFEKGAVYGFHDSENKIEVKANV